MWQDEILRRAAEGEEEAIAARSIAQALYGNNLIRAAPAKL
jgi:hypothetical protein